MKIKVFRVILSVVTVILIYIIYKVAIWYQLENAITRGDLGKAELCLKYGAEPYSDLEDGLSWVVHLIDEKKTKEATLLIKYGAKLGDSSNQYLKDRFKSWSDEQRNVFCSSVEFKNFPQGWPN